MTVPDRLFTDRLVLRRDWLPEHRASLARMCGDPRLMRFMVKLWTPADADEAIARWQASFAERSYGIWCVTERATGAFVGMVGVKDTLAGDPFPHVETEFAWRVDEPFWGCGYAGEAAIAAGNDAFARASIESVMAYTAASNAASRRVMEKLGLTYRPEENFTHPTLPDDDLRKNRVVYRIGAADWLARHRQRS
jgi:RimJ/RimL family protein N-acetyltransferase